MHTTKNKAKLLTRVRRIQGQAAALETQLDKDDDCTAVLQQITAIRGAVNGLMAAIIEDNLTAHIVKEPELKQREKDLTKVLHVI
jgi:DNA-binding FrmR family transcriptional regulator